MTLPVKNAAFPSRWLTIFIWAFLVGLLILNLLHKVQLASSYRPDLGGFERNVIWGIQQVMAGEPLYTDPQKPPFAIIQYMPLYYQLVGFLGNLLKVNPINAHQVYCLARGFNLALCCLSAGLLYITARGIFQIRLLPAFGAVVCGFLWMAPNAIAGRMDTLKTVLFQVLVLVLLSFPTIRKRFVFPAAAAIAAMAFFTKQDGLVFCGILPLTLLLQKKHRDFLIWSGISAGMIGAILLILSSVYGSTFWLNVVGGLENGISISWLIGSFNTFFGQYAILFGLGLVLAFEFSKGDSWHLHVLSAAMAIAFIPSFFFSFKYGSAPNYFMEAILISLLMLLVWMKNLSLGSLFTRANSVNYFAVLAVGLLFYISSLNWVANVFLNQESATKELYHNQEEVARYVRSALEDNDSWVLVDVNPQWEDHLTTLLFDKAVTPQRDVVLQVMEARGKLNFAPLETSIKAGATRYYVTEAGRRPHFAGAGSVSCKLLETIGGYQVWQREK